MTSPKTRSSAVRPIAFFVLGFALAAFGLFHSVNGYPAPGVFDRFADELPTVTAVASFAVGILAALVGLALLVPSIIRLRVRRPDNRADPFGGAGAYDRRNMPASRQVPARREDEFDQDPDGFAGDDYRGGYGGPHHENGDYEQRRWASSYR
jgi:hypothetical protein